jgi:Zn-dependent M16 (insulinase) family peptidase
VSFTCQPRDVATLARVVLRELDAMKTEGPTEQEVANRAEIAKREYETSVKYNSWWLDRLTTSFTIRVYSGDLSASFRHLEAMRKEVLDSLAPAVLQSVFQKHFADTQHHTIVTLRPSLLTLLTSSIKVKLEAVLGGRQVGLDGLVVGGGALLALSALVLFGVASSRRR